MTILIVKVLGIAGAIVLAGWLYWLTAKVLLLLTYAEQLFGMGAQLLGAVPGKSAERTVADEEQPPPSVRYAVLRALAAVRDRFDQLTAPVLDDLVDDVVAASPPEPTGPDLDRWADDGGRGPAPTVEPEPDEQPATMPIAMAWDTPASRAQLHDAALISGAETGNAPASPHGDAVDLVLAQFTYGNGHRR